jgi:hypothetical protein
MKYKHISSDISIKKNTLVSDNVIIKVVMLKKREFSRIPD